MSRLSAGHDGMSRSGVVIATVFLLIGCYLFATSIPSNEDTIGFEPWPSSSPVAASYDGNNLDTDIIIGIDLGTSSSPVASYDDNNIETIIIGIDLGTSTSRVSVYIDGRAVIIPNDQGNYITPPWVAFTDSSERPLVGEAAKDQAAENPGRTIFNVKRLIGREFVDEEVQRAMKDVPYKIVNKDGKPYIQVVFKDGKTKFFSPEEISAMILSKLKDTAEAFFGKKVTEAVVTVPAYFSDAQRQATKDAFSIAGWSAVTAYKEPLAIAYAYGLHKEASEKNVLFYHLGDGTFDVSVVEIDYGVLDYLAINADTHLGGEDFNQRIMEHFTKLIKDKYGKDISKDNGALVKLRMEAERAKRALSSQDLVRVEIDSLVDGVNLSEPLTRARFEELNKDLFLNTMGHVKKAMEDAGLEKRQIHEIVLVGGSTKIPKVQQLLSDYFDGRVEPKMSLNPDEVLAIGSAVLGDSLIRNGEKSKIC